MSSHVPALLRAVAVLMEAPEGAHLTGATVDGSLRDGNLREGVVARLSPVEGPKVGDAGPASADGTEA